MEVPVFKMRPLWHTLRIALEQGVDAQLTCPLVYDDDSVGFNVDPDADIRVGRMDAFESRLNSARTSFEKSLEAREATRIAANATASTTTTTTVADSGGDKGA